MLTISVSGLDELIRTYGETDAMDTVADPLQRGGYRIQANIATYPPAPPFSSYVRTGTLGRRWHTEQNRGPGYIEQKTGNNTEYAPFVQSAQFQRPIFQRIGWTTDEQVLEAELPRIVEDMEQAVADRLNGRQA